MECDDASLVSEAMTATCLGVQCRSNVRPDSTKHLRCASLPRATISSSPFDMTTLLAALGDDTEVTTAHKREREEEPETSGARLP